MSARRPKAVTLSVATLGVCVLVACAVVPDDLKGPPRLAEFVYLKRNPQGYHEYKHKRGRHLSALWES